MRQIGRGWGVGEWQGCSKHHIFIVLIVDMIYIHDYFFPTLPLLLFLFSSSPSLLWLPSLGHSEPSSVDQLGVALGYVAHLVHQLSRVLLIPLQYQILPKGSRTYICDHISDEALIDSIKE